MTVPGSPLSSMMTPPPIVPVATMDFLTQEYVLNEEPTTFENLLTTDLVVGSGGLEIDSIDYFATWPPEKVYPVAAPALLAEFQNLLPNGFTFITEYDLLNTWDVNDVDFPVVALYNYDPFADTPPADASGVVAWSYRSARDFSVVEGYSEGATSEFLGSTTQVHRGRRVRLGCTWGIPYLNQFRYGTSWNGTLQDDNVGGNGSPTRWNNAENLGVMLPGTLHSVHFKGVIGNNNNAWTWGPQWLRWRKFELWPARPTEMLHLLTMLEQPTPVRFSQLYAEVIHA